jgi:hypothetical protein
MVAGNEPGRLRLRKLCISSRWSATRAGRARRCCVLGAVDHGLGPEDATPRIPSQVTQSIEREHLSSARLDSPISYLVVARLLFDRRKQVLDPEPKVAGAAVPQSVTVSEDAPEKESNCENSNYGDASDHHNFRFMRSNWKSLQCGYLMPRPVSVRRKRAETSSTRRKLFDTHPHRFL